MNASSTNRPPLSRTVVILTAIAGFIGYVAWQRGAISADTLIFLAVLIPSIILHEVSHGALARVYGDHTAERAGRLTLNPLRHVDAFGTIILPAVLLLSSSLSGAGPLAFGYAKPVPVNTTFMSRNRTMFVGLVGPFSNIVLALIAALVISAAYDGVPPEAPFVFRALVYFGMANVILAVFNLIPIPPLDGSSVIERFLPRRYWEGYLKFRRYSMLILLGLMIFFNGVLNYLFDPALDLWFTLLR